MLMPGNLQVNSRRTYFSVVRFLLLAALLVTIGLAIIIMVGNQPFNSDPESLNKVIEIRPGMSTQRIALLLEEEGLIADSTLFRIIAKTVGVEKKLQAGFYLLNAHMRPLEIIDHLHYGEVYTEKVIIPEGFEIKQIAARLAEKNLADPERFIELASQAELVFGDDLPLELPLSSLEGYLYPSTYHFSPGQSEEELIGQMVNSFIQASNETILPLLENSEFSLHEVVTLASIVEKEIMVDEERPVVASVYLNRLAIGMPLQADPTVRYVTIEDRPQVLYRDLEIDSPYNTYRNRGLPPGPIASPGLASMLAVLRPAETDYLFFVSKRDGTHQFTKNYDEHLQARRELGY